MADWATELTAIQTKLGVAVPQDNKYSGQTLPQLIAEKANAVADVVYYGVSFGIQAQEVGVVAAYKPEHWDEIPAGLNDAAGDWFAIHSGTLGFFVRCKIASNHFGCRSGVPIQCRLTIRSP